MANGIAIEQETPVTRGHLREFTDDPIGCMQRLHAAHGDVSALQQGDQRIVFALGPECNRTILADTERFHSRFFVLRGPRNSAQRRLTTGLLSMNGEEHRTNRRLLRGPFQRNAIDLHHGTIVRLTNEMLDSWSPGSFIDVNREMLRLMLRLASAILFGVDDPELAVRIGERIDEWMHLNHETGVGAFVHEPDLDTAYERMLAVADDLEGELLALVDRRRDSAGSTSAPDVLSIMLRALASNEGFDRATLCGHVALLYGAAHLTTAHSLTWTLFLLAQHPEVAAECFAEVRSVGVPREAAALAGFPSMQRVVRESMRILPASAYVQRMCTETVELGPLVLPRGTPVVWSQYMTHHMERVFPDADSFDPDRWRSATPSPYEYLPYGAGARLCLGGAMANNILLTVLPMILSRFRTHCVAGTFVQPRVVSTTFGPGGELPMELAEPDGRFDDVPVGGAIHDHVRLRSGRDLRAA